MSFRKRILFLSFAVFFLLSVLVIQFFRVQIIDGEYWLQLARKQHYFSIKEPFERGKFLANTSLKKGASDDPVYLVYDVPKFHLYADPMSIPAEYHAEIAFRLKEKAPLSDKEREQLLKQLSKRSRSRKLAMWLDRADRERIAEWWRPYAKKRKLPINALYFVDDFQRSYPFGKLMGQVLQTIQAQKDEETHQAMPTGGLELSLNDYLQGKQGKRLLMRSPRNALEVGSVVQPPQNGADVHLTINHVIQSIVEEELEVGVRQAKAKGGWAVMMQPQTGEILALAQYPFFYPADYKRYFTDPELAAHTRLRAVTDANEPGSVMKPLTLAILLEANKELKAKGEKPIFHPEDKIASSDGHFPGRKQPITDTRVHKYLNMKLALKKSSNIYLARLIQKTVETLGDQWYHDQLQEMFGFGIKTGVELPAESRGVLPRPGKMTGKFLEWSKPTPFSLSFGYNLQANTIQLARAYSVLANGGYLVQPTLVKKITREGQAVVDNTKLAKRRVVDKSIIDQVLDALQFTSLEGGTARFGKIPLYTQGAKTGTARKIENGTYTKKKHVASYVGFAPLKKAEFVLIVCVDEPEVYFVPGKGNNNHGSICAAPIFREIGKRTLAYLGVSPDDPFGYPQGDPRYDPEKAAGVVENRKLQEMYETWNN